MAVGTFNQPNHEEIGLEGTEYKADIDNSIAAMSRIGAAFAPHEQTVPNMTVRVDAGALLGALGPTEIAAQSTGTITAPSSNPRIDRVVIDAFTGVVSVVTGTEAASPDPPDLPASKLPICQVALETSTTAIDNTMITDERVMGGGSGTAFQDILIGDIYITTNNYADSAAVAAAKGYGTWVRFGEGRMMVGYKAIDSDFDTVEKTGGAKTNTPAAHRHITYGGYDYLNTEIALYRSDTVWTNQGGQGDLTDYKSAGVINILNPYIVVFMWKRTA